MYYILYNCFFMYEVHTRKKKYLRLPVTVETPDESYNMPDERRHLGNPLCGRRVHRYYDAAR